MSRPTETQVSVDTFAASVAVGFQLLAIAQSVAASIRLRTIEMETLRFISCQMPLTFAGIH
jgi:hypothetical protein